MTPQKAVELFNAGKGHISDSFINKDIWWSSTYHNQIKDYKSFFRNKKLKYRFVYNDKTIEDIIIKG